MISATWDGITLATGLVSAPVSRVDLNFWYYAYDGPQGASFFGTESIDRLMVEGDPVIIPEPKLLLPAALGGAVAVGVGLRRSHKRRAFAAPLATSSVSTPVPKNPTADGSGRMSTSSKLTETSGPMSPPSSVNIFTMAV